MATNIYALRRAILAALKGYSSVPVRAVDLKDYSPEPAILVASLDEVRTEWSELAGMGYIAPVEGFSGEYCKITELGRRQLAPEYAHDPFVWGPLAAK